MIKLEEVEWFGFISTLLGLVVFIMACFWDNIIGVSIHNNKGYGWMQLSVMVGSGIYSCWALSIAGKWREYINKIHKAVKKHDDYYGPLS